MAARHAGPLPVIDAAVCVLGRLAAASCTACAQACPKAALQGFAEGLTLNADQCSACGACSATCPQGAIVLDGIEAPEVQARGDRTAAALVCPRRASDPAAAICLQALGLGQLAALWLAGLRRLVTVTADCATCPDGRGLDLAGRLATLNTLLADRALPPLVWQGAAHVPKGLPPIIPAPKVDSRRRALIGLFSPAAVPPGASAVRPLARLQALGADAPPSRAAYVPQISALRCTGCDACLQVCPKAALSLIKDEAGEMMYQASSFRCSGCGLCADVCSEDAMRIDGLAPLPAAVPLTGVPCRGCGVAVHVPTAGPWAGGGLCPVCRRTGHHRRLHQVLT